MKKILLLMIAMVVTVASYAQITTSGISGVVADKSGDALIGATVIAIHTPSGTEYGAATNTEGRYTMQGMRTGGPYTVTVSYIGYQTLETTDLMLKLGETTTFSCDLAEGVNLESIEIVSTADSRFNDSKTGAAMNFNSAAIESTPTVSRSVYDVATLSPFVNSYDDGISFSGSNNRYNSFQIDGAMANDVFGLADAGINGGSTGSNAVALDAIEELQVVVAPFDVRQSGFTGGGINAVTKSGTNTFKASAYTYYNNENFYGTTAGALDEGETREKATEQTTQVYGFTAGGALIKDKLFAFVSAEKNKSVEPVDYYPGVSSSYISEATVNTIMDAYYDVTGIQESYSTSNPNTSRESIDLLARIDYNISQKHKLMVRYQYKDAFDDAYGAYSSSYYFNGSSYSYNNKTHSVVAELNSRLSNRVSNEFRATFTSVRDHRELDYLGPLVKISNVDFGVDSSGDARTGTVYIGTEAYSGANAVNQDVYTISDNVSIYKGAHTITAGTHNEIYKIGNTFISNATGTYSYNSLDDFLADSANSYQLTYAVNSDNQDYMPIMNAGQFGFYVQDEWKPNNNFTLTAGLRADIAAIFNDPTVNEAFNSSDLTNDGEYMVGRSPKTQVLWSPRVGFRYHLNDEHTSLLRGGAGIFTGRVPFVWLHNAFSNNGVDKKSISVYASSGSVPALSDYGSTDGVVGTETINIVSEDFKYPQVFRANLAYEHNFTNGWKATVEGLYTKNINDVTFSNVALSDNGLKVYTVSADAATESNTATYYNNDSGDYYAIINLENTNKGYSYNLSAMVEKSFDFGLNAMASYSFGKAYSVNGGTSSQAVSNWRYNYAVNSNDNELGLSTYGTPHNIKLALNYVSPMYANGRLNTVVGLTYNGSAGYRYSYCYNDTVDINGDGAYGSSYGNTLLYIPTEAEIDQMTWDSVESKESFRSWVNSDNYASSHRGEFCERNGVVSPMEHHINLHIAENFIYNKERKSRVEISLDIMNIGNLLNREWGMYKSSVYSLRPLQVTNMTEVDGGYTPTYSWSGSTEIYDSEFASRWYMQLGARITF
ncbi:MAG: TonB-dependent receptor [Rikenellaceae bacterium]